jgi:putative phosphoesterase
MRILVFSDSHGLKGNILKALNRHRNDTDLAIHLGDGIGDMMALKDDYPQIAFAAVAGNCDSPPIRKVYSANEEENFSFEGVRIFACHGHRFSVKYKYDELIKEALKNRCSLILFGHTHQPVERFVDSENGRIHIFNPGSISRPDSGPPSYGYININNGQMLLSHGRF